jgi:hypothetical protein
MLDVDLTAEFPQTSHEAAEWSWPRRGARSDRRQVAVRHAVAEHAVPRAEHGGRNGEDGFLGAAPGFEAEELGLEARALRPYGGPGGRTPRFAPSSARWPATTSGGARRASTVNSSSSASSSARPPCRLSSPVGRVRWLARNVPQVCEGGWDGQRRSTSSWFPGPHASSGSASSLISSSTSFLSPAGPLAIAAQ